MGVLVPGTTSWPDAIPIVVVAALLVFLPGLVAGLILRISLYGALMVAPLVSTTCVAVGGVVAEWLELRWGVGTLVGAVLLMWLFAGVVHWVGRRILQRRGQRRLVRRLAGPSHAASTAERTHPFRSSLFWASAAGLSIAFAVFCASVLPEISTPEAIPQHPDTIFHLGAAQWALDSGTISSFAIGQFQSPGWTGFYPAAFHGFTATISLMTGSSVVVASQSFVLVLGGVVWPLGCIGLASALLGRRPSVALVGGLMSVLFTGFPYLLMGFGVLWPNLFGQALLPAALTLLLSIRGSRAIPPFAVAAPFTAIPLLVVAMPALVLAHPNGFVAFALFGLLILLGWFGEVLRRRRRTVRRAAVGIMVGSALILAATLTAFRPSSMVNGGSQQPQASAAQAAASALLLAPPDTLPLLVLGIMTIFGLAVILRAHPGARWVVPAWGIMMSLYWLNLAVGTDWVRHFTWPWYNEPIRIQAVAILPAVIASTAGLLFLPRILAGFLSGRFVRNLSSTARRHLGTTVVFAVFFVATGFGYLTPHQRILNSYFHPAAPYSWISDQELRSLRQLASYLPTDARVAANPWNGATYLYVVSGRRLLVPTEKTNFAGDRALLSRHLNEVGTNPAVCDAAQRQHVDWAITGGLPFARAGDRVDQYIGVDAVDTSPAWRIRATSAPYNLYERVSCAR